MGLTTSLYAIDIDQLKKKLGSNDSKLIEKLAGKQKKVASAKAQDLRVRIDLDGHITIAGIPRTAEFLAAEIVRPKWARRELIVTYQPGKRPNRYSPNQVVIVKMIDELATRTKFACFVSDWDWSSEEDEEISTEHAAIDLVMGRCTRPDCASEYGYGLKLLCDDIGKHLGVIGGELQAAIAWKTRLLQLRSPIKLPAFDDFPSISYLTAKEASVEYKRFSEMDQSDIPEKWKILNRKQFIQFLRKASEMKQAIIAFCH
jgi:hypothetical protein